MSKRFVLFTSITALFSTALYSNQIPEEFSFIGLTATQNQIDFQTQSNLLSTKELLTGLRYGQQTLKWRTMFSLSAQDKLQEFTLEIDKILLDDMFGYPEVRPYLGATLGYLYYENDLLTKENGYYFGGTFGFLLYLTDTIDIDISYHYKTIQDIDGLDTMRGPSIGIHYFY